MTYMLIAGLLIIFILGILFGIGLAQAAGKDMPKPTRKISQIKGVNSLDAESIRQATKDEPLDRIANDREMW